MSKTKLVTIIILFLLLFVICTPALAVERIIKIGGDHNYPPYEFMDNAGNYRGFNVDIMHAIALDQGFTAEFVPLDWDDAQKALLQNEIDVVQGMTYSPLRDKIYRFCQPMVTNAQAIFVPRNVYTIISLSDLQGLRVGVEYGDISIELLSEYPKVNLIKYQTQDEAMQALIKGEIDAFVGNELTGWYLLEKWRHLEEFKQVGESLHTTRYGPVVRKDNPETAKIINQGLTNIKANGTYDKIYRKWFGQTRIDNTRYLRIGLILFALVLLLMLAIFQVNRRLKKEVGRRTQEIATYASTQRIILDNTPSGLVIVNPEGIIEDSNPAGTILIGGPTSGRLAADTPLLHFLSPGEIERIINTQLTLEKQIDIDSNSYQVKVLPLTEGAARLLISISDITAQKLVAKQEFEEAKTKALATLVAGLAHEIRNPLTSVKTFIELIPLKINNPVFRQRLTEVLPHEIGRIEQLVQELLEYARHRQVEPQICNLESTLAPVIDLLAMECERKEVKLNVKLTGEAFCDPRHLVQIILNLGLNSLKAVTPGDQITIYSMPMGQDIRVTVEDSGCGIPKEFYIQLFDPFFSLQGGTGMGLALVAQMVGENLGRITFESKEGLGTHFHIWLPAGQGEANHET